MRRQIMNALSQTSILFAFLVAGMNVGMATAQEGSAAAPTKIGVIDVRRLVSDSDAGKQALQELEALRDTRSAELDTASQELEQLQKQITEGRLSLSEERLNELNRELEDKTTAYRRTVQDAERQLQEAQARSFGTIEREVLPLIRAIGDEQSFAVILSITDGGVVYAPEQVNITDLVVERYNTQKASETPPPAEG